MRQTHNTDVPHKIGLFSGLEAFGRGIGFVVGTPRVWGYALVPASCFCCCLASSSAWPSGDHST